MPFNEAPAWVKREWDAFISGFGTKKRVPQVRVFTGTAATIGHSYDDRLVRRILAYNARTGKVQSEYVPGYESLLGSTRKQQELYQGGNVQLAPGNSMAVFDLMHNFAQISLYMHPADFQPSKAVGPVLSERQRKVLATVRAYTSVYRREVFAKNRVTQRELDELNQMGLINKANAITIMGRNVSGPDRPYD